MASRRAFPQVQLKDFLAAGSRIASFPSTLIVSTDLCQFRSLPSGPPITPDYAPSAASRSPS